MADGATGWSEDREMAAKKGKGKLLASYSPRAVAVDWRRIAKLSDDAIGAFRALLAVTLGAPSADLRTVDTEAPSQQDLVMLLAAQAVILASRTTLTEREKRKVMAALAVLAEKPPVRAQKRTERAVAIVEEATRLAHGTDGSNASVWMLFELGSKVDPKFLEFLPQDVENVGAQLSGVDFKETARGLHAKRTKVRTAENILAKAALLCGALGYARTRPNAEAVNSVTRDLRASLRRSRAK